MNHPDSESKPESAIDLAGHYLRLNRLLVACLATALMMPSLLMPLRGWAPWAFPRCPSLVWFDRPCPLCGLTRGVAELARGHLDAAQALNVLSLPVWVLLILELLIRGGLLLRPAGEPALRRAATWDGRIHVGLLIAYVLYAIGFTLNG